MTEFNCLPTMIGSMPHTDPAEACSLVSRYLKDFPAWPQLPQRSFKENMYVQFSQGFPGVVVREDSIHVDKAQDLDGPLEQLYAAFLESDFDKYPISFDHAAGLYSFLDLTNLSPLAVKGQLTGPVTWGLTIADSEGKPIIYDDVLGDAVAKFLWLKAGWQERELKKISQNTIIFVDEPYMVAYGATSSELGSPKKVISLLEEVFRGISGLKGVHCCGNTDWSVLLETSLDILSFDAYNYTQSLSLYPEEVKGFLNRGGVIAWGIVPNDETALAKETVASLKDRLEEAMAPFTRNGTRFQDLLKKGLLTPSCGFQDLLKQSLLTPSCGLASLDNTEAAAHALELLAKLSQKIRKGIRK